MSEYCDLWSFHWCIPRKSQFSQSLISGGHHKRERRGRGLTVGVQHGELNQKGGIYQILQYPTQQTDISSKVDHVYLIVSQDVSILGGYVAKQRGDQRQASAGKIQQVTTSNMTKSQLNSIYVEYLQHQHGVLNSKI